MRVLLIEPDPTTAQAAIRRIQMHLRPNRIDHVDSHAEATEHLQHGRYSLIIPEGDGGQSLIDAVLASHGDQQQLLRSGLDEIQQQLKRMESNQSDTDDKLRGLQRAMYGDPHNGAKGIVRRIDRIEWSVQIGAVIAGAVLVAVIGLAVGKVFT